MGRYFFFFRLFILLGATTYGLYAQSSLSLQIIPLDTTTTFIQKKLKPAKTFQDSLAIIQYLGQQIQVLHNAAFLEASVDSLQLQDTLFKAYLHLGKAYEWGSLDVGNVDQVFLEKAGFKPRLYQGKPIVFAQLNQLQDQILTAAENRGFPFAKVRLNPKQIHPGEVSAELFLDKGPLILFDSIQIEGEVKISKTFLQNYLGIQKGQPYDLAKVLRIRARLRELSFLQAKSDPQVTFQDDKAIIKVELAKRRSSQFDFILGVLPNNQETGRLLITGTFDGELQNQFGLGERIFVAFEQLRPQTPELEIGFNYPYVLNFPFGLDTKFGLYRRDSSYIDLELEVGVQYLLEGGNYLKAFWNNRSTTLLNLNEDRLVATQQLPDTLDVNNATFGIEFNYQQLDYRFNPRKGWGAFIRGGAGIKEIERNPTILDLELGGLYDSLELRTFQYRIDAVLEGYLPLFKRSVLKASVRSGIIISEQPIYFNEQYRIGGNRLLRGFDEESILATDYAVGTLEYRLLIGQNSYLYLFGDYAYVLDRTSQKDITDYPFGFGTGISFETRAGLFGVSIAYGSQLNNPIDFGAPKVHFGYISLF